MKRSIDVVQRLLIIATIAMLFGVAGCSGSNTPTVPVTLYPPAIDQIKTNINEASGLIPGFNVSFYVDLNEFVYTKPVHIIYYLDENPPINEGVPAYSAPGTFIVKEALDEPAVWKNIPPGNHTFSAQVVDTDDKPFEPPIIAQYIINVPSSGNQMPELRLVSLGMDLPHPQSIQVTAPQPIPPIEAQVSCSVHNFKINDDSIGKQNVSGEGHYIYYLDTEPPITKGQSAIPSTGKYKVTAQDFYNWEELGPGRHKFSVQLVNNDNTPLESPVIVQIIVTLPPEI